VNETGEETFIAEGIDEAGDAFCVVVDAPESAEGESGFAVGAGGLETMLDVGPEFPAFEGVDVETDGDALTELPELMLVEAGA
jgi:hypothetical protein